MRFSEAMNDLIQVRVRDDEKRYIAEAARRSGTTISDLIRRSVMTDRPLSGGLSSDNFPNEGSGLN